MWDSFNPKKNGELIGLDMIFIDEKENLMHATINKKLYNKFKDKLTEGSLSVIKNFKVVESSGGYRPIENMIDSRVNNNTVLSVENVVGCLCGVGDMEIVGSRWKKRDIQIVTDYSDKAKITLWEEFGEKFNPYLYKNDSGMYIVIVTATAVKEFRGEVSFATSYASKIYINLNVDYITSLIQMFATVSAGVQTIERSNVNSIPIEEEMSFNKMNIKELLDCDWVLN
ncbi:uncharacterized protein LOC107777486 isoform X2 [Nicotiana tabacum]|uniref:Uncharacterized protein LOC107777486 isoform X2 n=1 Tax=Nicotiana tabacum TaxID=4097 RepID=A0A1S3YLW9_TOBAC|nr:PREDICTED: uncharacterized protein LOC107777486 [Nicotiana tabacum]XP_016453003.1 PREDICTED: uncharacterized protein LOC107777486 [Nicotiana tabacum]XP_016453004.1 PREDICTED: uncharacterized protein LOC107777486 [Nicotiana tabacum]XP_016453005.1 PREDICTED: uncharacterized protein LOC107777486 [Nicotiana tabacum]